MARKTEFELDTSEFKNRGAGVQIFGDKGQYVHVGFYGPDNIIVGFIKDRDLERFAVNILKALGSNKLKS